MKTFGNAVYCGIALGLVSMTSTAYGDLVGYFKFDDFPGNGATFTDDSGMGLSGYLGFPFSDPGSVEGPSGQAGDMAVSFDGRGALAVDDSAAEVLNILVPPFTLECWARATTNPGGHLGLISYGIPGGRTGGGGYKLGVNASGNLLFTLFAVVDVNSTIPFPFDGEWHHVAAVYSVDEGGVLFYLDGEELQFVAEARNVTSPAIRQLDIGAQYTGLGRWPGDIDRVRISTAALSADELDSDASAEKPVGDNTLVFFGFDEGDEPYQGEGVEPAGVAVSTSEWILTNPLRENAGMPTRNTTNTPSGAAGDIALGFSGAQMAVVQDPNGVLNMDGDWTLEAWVNYSILYEGERDMLYYYGHPGRGYSLSINYAEGEVLQVTTLGIADMPSETAVLDFDVWQHVAVVHVNGESITYYVNGEEAGSRAYTGGTRLAQDTQALYIGAEWNGDLPFTGLIDRIRISNSALTPDQLDSDPAAPTSIGSWNLY